MGRLIGAIAVGEVELKFVNTQRDRQGQIAYFYFRRNGRRWRLPGKPGEVAFAEEYSRLLAETSAAPDAGSGPDRKSYPRGSFGALVNEYLSTANYREKKLRVRAEYKRVLESLQNLHGQKPVRALRRRHIRRMRDERAETPGAANTIVRMLKIVLNFAVEEELIESSPAAKMKLLRVGEWRDWSDDECARFEKRWPAGTMERRAYMLSSCTGQRKADIVSMTRAHRRQGTIRVLQGKGSEEVWIPEHRDLAAELARGSQDHMSLLTTTRGKAFDEVYFGAWFAEAIDEAGLPDDCVLHGLRKTAARRLADAGCSEEEIKAITGHQTSRMVSHYTKTVEKKKRAQAAIRKLENSR